MAHDVELVVQDRRLRCPRHRHRCETASTCPSPPSECPGSSSRRASRRTAPCWPLCGPLLQTRSGALESGRSPRCGRSWPLRIEISSMPMALGPGVPTRAQLRPHVLLLQVLDCLPVKMQFLRHVLHRGRSTAPADVVGKALRVMRVVGQERESLAFHLATTAASDPPHLELEVDARIPVGQIACSAYRAVVPAAMRRPAAAADRFFERRTSVMTRALRSPNTPRSIVRGRKPENRYASARRIGFDEVGIAISCQISTDPKSAETKHPRAFQAG